MNNRCAKYVQLNMKQGWKHPQVIFFFSDGTGKCEQVELTLDTLELAMMFDEAVFGIAPDIMSNEYGIEIQYNLDYAMRTVWIGK